ncbi:MAG: recombination regulator RecX [Candidatus Peribacteria bacterium]|jgi:regulatory protein|nr:recombination regulator RecX [Candidatus Peribacteria bacterium]
MSNPCLEYAISYLARYPKTEQEMSILLYRKGYNTEQIRTTMASLKNNHFIDDEKYAESYLYSEIVKKGKPTFLITQKLQQRGIDKTLTQRLIEEMHDDINEGITKGIRKNIETYKKKGVEGFEIIQKLMKKGYPLATIKAVIQQGK